MIPSFLKSKKDRGGVVLVALLTLSFGAVGALVFVQLIATRAQMVDSANNALQRRVVLSNSKALAKQYLYDQIIPANFEDHDTAVSYTLTDGSDDWAQFAMAPFTPTQYVGNETPLTRLIAIDRNGNENKSINEYQNRFSYGHNSRAYTVKPEISLGDGVAFMAARPDEEIEFVGTPATENAFRVFQHRMTFFIKARSPLTGGDGVYTLANDPDQAPGRIAGLTSPSLPNVFLGGRAYHTASTSHTSSNYAGSGENIVGAVPGAVLGAGANGPGISNFPDIVHSWGRSGLVTQAADYEGRLPILNQNQEFARFQSGFNLDGVSQFRLVSENVNGNYPGLDGDPELNNVPVLESRRVTFGGAPASTITPTQLPDETYRSGSTFSVNPNHSAEKIPTLARVFPSGTDMALNEQPPAPISQTLRQESGLTINTLRINFNTLSEPVFVEAGVEELEILFDGTYDGQDFATNPNRGASLIFLAQPQALQRIRFYGSQNNSLLYLSITDTSPRTTPPATPTRLDWWWHDTGDITANPRPSFRLFAEVDRSLINFQFADVAADVEVIGGFRHSNNISAGLNSTNQLFITPETIDPTVTSENTLSRIERAAHRVGWIETYITAGAEGDRPVGTF
ncbi:hypothetical protein OAF27_00415 [Verrucomicrobiales bacterium]|nr:hypothetical protein [Verrucomicrobiales bacterium]